MSKMMMMRQNNVEKMAMRESDYYVLKMYMESLEKKMKKFLMKVKKIEKMTDVEKIHKEVSELVVDMTDVIGPTSPSPKRRFSPNKDPRKKSSKQK